MNKRNIKKQVRKVVLGFALIALVVPQVAYGMQATNNLKPIQKSIFSSVAMRDVVNSRDLKKLKQIINKDGFDINGLDYFGDTLLHYAVEFFDNKHPEVLELLLKQDNINLYLENYGCEPPAFYALRLGKLGALKVIVESKKLDINQYNSEGYTLLHTVVWYCSITEEVRESFLSYLLSLSHIDVNIRDVNSYTSLHIAVQYGIIGSVKLLVNHEEIDINAITFPRAKEALGKFFIVKNISYFPEGYFLTPLHIAINNAPSNQKLSLIKLLVGHGADVFAKSHNEKVVCSFGVKSIELAYEHVSLQDDLKMLLRTVIHAEYLYKVSGSAIQKNIIQEYGSSKILKKCLDVLKNPKKFSLKNAA